METTLAQQPEPGVESGSEEVESSSYAEQTGEEDGAGSDSFTDEEDAIEEAAFAAQDMPGAGLSPRLVVRRGVEALQQHAAGPAPAVPLRPAPAPAELRRVDTMAGFEEAVGASPSSSTAAADQAPAPPLERENTMSTLLDVKAAFSAVGDGHDDDDVSPASLINGAKGAAASPGGGGKGEEGAEEERIRPPCEPSTLRRVDTMELLQAVPTDRQERPSKRSRLSQEA